MPRYHFAAPLLIEQRAKIKQYLQSGHHQRRSLVRRAFRGQFTRVALDSVLLVGAQASIQLVNVVSGIVIVRALSADEYAVYTLANAIISIGTVLATMSVPGAVTFLLSRGQYCDASVLAESKRIANVLSILAAVVVTGAAVVYRSVLGNTIIIVVVVAFAAVFWSSRANLWKGVAFARRHAILVARADFISALARLFLILAVIGLALGVDYGVVFVCINAVAFFVVERLLRERVPRGHVEPALRRAIMRFVLPLVPEHVYYVLQGQLAILILALMSEKTVVAEFGALSRLALLITALSVINIGIFQPFIARYRSPKDYLRRSAVALGLWIGVAGILVVVAIWYSDVLVRVLGPQYAHLEALVPITMLWSGVTLVGGTLYTVVLASGRPAALSLAVPVGLGVQTTYFIVVDVTSVERALGLALATAIGELLTRAGAFAWVASVIGRSQR